jgi:maleate isomerase
VSTNDQPNVYVDSSTPFAPALLDVAIRLLNATASSRTTVRLSRRGTAELVAEARQPGIMSMADHVTPGIMAAPTYAFLQRERTTLVQDDCRTGDPAPPPSLIADLHVYAQMLAPVVLHDEMIGTISVHQQGRPRHWVSADTEALAAAQAEVETILALAMTESTER